MAEMRWFERIIQAHTSVTDRVSHGELMPSEARCFVWQEDESRDLLANDRHVERAVHGSTDFFTKIEFDPWLEQLEKALDRYGIAWRQEYTDFDEETGFWHYEILWRVYDGKI